MSGFARLYRVILPVKNIDVAAQFYGDVFQASGERVSPGRHYFNCGGTILALYDPLADGDGLGHGWSHHSNQYIYFAVPDLDGVLGRVGAGGARIDAEIATMPWGERIFYAKDPFDNPIAFVDESTAFLGHDEGAVPRGDADARAEKAC